MSPVHLSSSVRRPSIVRRPPVVRRQSSVVRRPSSVVVRPYVVCRASVVRPSSVVRSSSAVRRRSSVARLPYVVRRSRPSGICPLPPRPSSVGELVGGPRILLGRWQTSLRDTVTLPLSMKKGANLAARTFTQTVAALENTDPEFRKHFYQSRPDEMFQQTDFSTDVCSDYPACNCSRCTLHGAYYTAN